ncbi:hypothetical protein MVEN_01712400 [Mycena venus]|uniref:DUF6532 domain-containing protein n=1 Tax=Mycena venus TaxID=2733690 RepID=A0A8H7CQ75_9AGAR|nr:hypothetical protein MVEN_01712400 [Mycena venus]
MFVDSASLLLTSTMTRPLPVESSDDEGSPPLQPVKTKPRQSRDDVSGNQTFSNRTRGHDQRRPSGKQDQTDKENLDATRKKMEKAAKEYEKAKRQLSKQSKTSPPPSHDDDGPESEDQLSDADNTISFQSSIKALAPLPREAPRPAGVICQPRKKANAPPGFSSRTFLSLPEAPASGAASDDPEPTSPILDDMHLDSDDLPPGNGPADTPDFGRAERDRHSHRDSNKASSSSTDRGRSTTGNSGSAGSGKRPQASSPAPPPPAKRKRQDPQFAEGYIAIARAKPKAADYEPVVNALLIRAMAEYSMLILTLNAFPDIALQMVWAKQCFSNACHAANERFKINTRIIKLITKRGSHIRSQIVAAVRALFANHYKFKSTSTTPAAIKYNRDLSDKLIEGAAFHYKDVNASTGYAQNIILSYVRKAVVFKTKTSLGAIFASHFTPYPLPTLALDSTTATVNGPPADSWPREFKEKHLAGKYTTHLTDIRNWADMNKTVVDNLRLKWYTRAFRTLAGPSLDVSTNISDTRAEALRDELAGRTGLTDSETEEVDAEE